MLLSLFYISLRSSKSMILKVIWSLTPSMMIRYVIPTAIRFSSTFLKNRVGFCCLGRGFVKTRSHTSFSIIIDLVIIDYIGQFAKSVSFSHLAYVLLLDSSTMTEEKAEVKRRFLLIAFKIRALLCS